MHARRKKSWNSPLSSFLYRFIKIAMHMIYDAIYKNDSHHFIDKLIHTHIHFIILIHFIGDILHSSFIVCSINFTTPITFSFLAPTRILLYYFYIVLKRWLYIGNIAASIETKREKKTIKKWWVCVSLNWKLNAYKMVADSSPCRIISHSNLTIPKLNYL